MRTNTKHFECCCCGGSAPALEQWWNRDLGFGLCGSCATWIQARTDYDPEDFVRTYGVQGVHWFPKEERVSE